MRNIKYGGQIVPGDFIAVAFNNHIDFGWYAGNGRGTLQYYHFRVPMNAHDRWDEWNNQPDEEKSKSWRSKQYKNGFTSKCLWKSYINSVHETRVIRITNIEDIFTEPEDRDSYEKSKEVLIKLNLIKK
jgi:hypothetical protein